MGQHVGSHLLDLMFVREQGYKRETKLLKMLLFIKTNLWKVFSCTIIKNIISSPLMVLFKFNVTDYKLTITRSNL